MRKKQLLSFVPVVCALFVGSVAVAIDPDEYYFDTGNTYTSVFSFGSTVYGYGNTEGYGAALSKVRVASTLYIGGKYQTADYDNGTTYAQVSFSNPEFTTPSMEVRSSHKVYNTVSEYQSMTSKDYWPVQYSVSTASKTTLHDLKTSKKNKPIPTHIKKDHAKTLKQLGIQVDESSLENLSVCMDKNSETWLYTSFFDSHLLEEKMRNKFSQVVSTSFVEVQDELMAREAQKGDTSPVLLINEDLTKGKFVFLRGEGKGKLLSFDIALDAETMTWNIVN